MGMETQAIEIITQILSMDDNIIEKDYETFLKLFQSESTFQQAMIEKLAYCRANYLTEDDLIEENKMNLINFVSEIGELSNIKRKLFLDIFAISNKINEKIIEDGLYPKVNVRVEKIDKNAELPRYAHENGDSGLDVKAIDDLVIEGHKTVIMPTRLKVAIPLGYEIQVRPRSGNSINYQNLLVANSPGTIDANYRNEVGIILKNIGNDPILISKGTKIAQLVLCPVIKLQWIEVDDINEFPTERHGGFGSTGA